MNYIYQIINVLDSKSHIKKIDSQDVQKRVEDLLKRGFIYNPYDDKFFNVFFNGIKTISSVSLVNLDWNKFIPLLDSTIKSLKPSINTNEKITKLYNRETNHFLLDIKLMSGILGVLFFVISIVLFFFISINFVTPIVLVSFLFVRYYSIWNNLSSEYQGEFGTSPVWRKNKNKYLILNFTVLIFLSFCLYEILNNFLFTILISILIHFLSNEIFIRFESKNYFHQSIFDTLYSSEYMNNFNETLENI